jgi:hypothetical protein
VKIVIKDVGKNGDHFEVKAESYPEITEAQVADISKLSLAQYAALRIMEFVNDGLDATPRKTESNLLKKAHKSDKGLH